MSQRQTDPWVKIGVIGTLAWLWRGPLKAVFLFLLAVVAVSMLIVPSWTVVSLGLLVGFVVFHHVRRRRL